MRTINVGTIMAIRDLKSRNVAPLKRKEATQFRDRLLMSIVRAAMEVPDFSSFEREWPEDFSADNKMEVIADFASRGLTVAEFEEDGQLYARVTLTEGAA